MTAATFMSTMSIPLGPGGRERAGPPQQLQLTPHGIGEVLIQIDAAGIGCERPPRLHDRGVDRHEARSEEHTSELQSLAYLVCRLLLEKKKQLRWPRPPA